MNQNKMDSCILLTIYETEQSNHIEKYTDIKSIKRHAYRWSKQNKGNTQYDIEHNWTYESET